MSFEWRKEIVLITGASSGLGKALAIEAGARGATVVMIARNKEILDMNADRIHEDGGKAYSFKFDLSKTKNIYNLYETIKEEIEAVPTCLINNAGYAAAGFVANTPVNVYERNFQVNVFAAIAMIQCVLPDMLKIEKGVIANVMGSAMYHSFPGMSSYCATKVALNAIHESLKIELSGLSVHTLYINPGVFDSNFYINADLKDRLGSYGYPRSLNASKPETIAPKILDAIEKGKEEIVLMSFFAKVGYNLKYWYPNLLNKLLVNRNQELITNRPK